MARTESTQRHHRLLSSFRKPRSRGFDTPAVHPSSSVLISSEKGGLSSPSLPAEPKYGFRRIAHLAGVMVHKFTSPMISISPLGKVNQTPTCYVNRCQLLPFFPARLAIHAPSSPSPPGSNPNPNPVPGWFMQRIRTRRILMLFYLLPLISTVA